MPVALAAIEDARRRIAGTALRSPLVRLNGFDMPAEIYLKLENLQPIGSFKIRGAANAMAHLSPAQLRAWRADGVSREHGTGRGLASARAGHPLHGRGARYCTGNQAPGHRPTRRACDQGSLRALVADVSGSRLSRCRCAHLFTPLTIRT